jgi:hypothetical protein
MGEWKRSEIGYLEPYSTACALCGQLVPGRYWSERVEGVEHVFCDPDHAARYESYWLPRYGNAARGADVRGPGAAPVSEVVAR